MNLRLVDTYGNLAVAGGPSGIQLIDTESGNVLGEASGHFTDVLMDYEIPLALAVTPGNPATVNLRTYGRNSVANYSTTPQFNPPNGGRIAKNSGNIYWQSGRKVRMLDGITIDTGYSAHDVGGIKGGFVIVSGATVQAWNSTGTIRWERTLPVTARYIASSDDYVVVWGGGNVVGGNLTIPVSVLDAATGNSVAQINQVGTNLIACAALAGSVLYIGKPKYVTGQPTAGQIEVYDLADRGQLLRTVQVEKPPLAISATPSGAIYVGDYGYRLVPLSALQPFVVAPTPDPEPVDPFDAWFSENQFADPAIVAKLSLIGDILEFTKPSQYSGLYALLS